MLHGPRKCWWIILYGQYYYYYYYYYVALIFNGCLKIKSVRYDRIIRIALTLQLGQREVGLLLQLEQQLPLDGGPDGVGGPQQGELLGDLPAGRDPHLHHLAAHMRQARAFVRAYVAC